MILFLIVGCTWIGDDDYSARLPMTDDDKDGVIDKDDCNDDDSSIGPEFEEIFYNGIDENCDGKDDFDQDQDGFVNDEFVGKITATVSNSGQLQGGDCDDQDLPEISSVERLTDSDVSKLASIDGEGITSFVWNIPSGISSALLEVTGLTVDADVELLNPMELKTLKRV